MAKDMRHNPDLDAAFGQEAQSPAAEPLTPEQIEALTDALKDLTQRIERQPAGNPTGSPTATPNPVPWWIKDKANYPGVPSFDPSFQPKDPAHRQWWARGTAGAGMGGGMGGGKPPGTGDSPSFSEDPDPDDFSFVRSFWRRKAQRRAERRGDARSKAEDVLGEPPLVTDARTPWNRQRKRMPWQWSFSRKAGAWARMKFGKRAGRGVTTGVATAASRLAWGRSPHAALRAGLFAGSAAGGGAALATVGLATAAVMAARALERLTDRQLEYNRHLGESSALMRQVFAERDVQQRLREREMGDRLSPSARNLTQAEQREKEGTKELDIALNRVGNEIGAAWENFKTALFFQLNEYSRVFNYFIELIEGKSESTAMDDWARRMAGDDAKARKEKNRQWEAPRFK